MAVTINAAWRQIALAIYIVAAADVPVAFWFLNALVSSYLVVCTKTTLSQELNLLFGNFLTMERQAEDLLAVLKNTNVSAEVKVKHITELKAHIKHRHVPDAAISPSFEIIRIGIMSYSLHDAAFSTLSHLTKRLALQEQQDIVTIQGIRTYPLLVERLGDQKDRVRLRASQAFTDFWSAAPVGVEEVIRDVVLSGKNLRAKEAGLQWVSKMNQEQGLQFRSFVPRIVDCLEDADGTVREAAKVTAIELFQHAPEHAKSDLKKQLQQRNVRKTIATHILSHLGLAGPQEVDLNASTHSHVSDPPRKDELLASSVAGEYPAAASPSSIAEDAEQLEPIYVNTYRELEDIFRDMQPHFEGKESEQNWTHREKSVVKLRKITRGNAPNDFTTTYLVCIKGLLDGILKTVNSLRTTVSTNGCHLVQDIAKAAGPGLDPMVEILLQSLIKLCGGTKKISAQNGNATVNAIVAYVTYNVRLMQHIWTACQDKNVQPRSFATEWLKTVITKHGHHKHILEHAGGLELIEKCIKKGLTDANPGVRTSMRATYWAFWRVWPDRSDVIMPALDAKQQEQLLKDPANPNLSNVPAPTIAATAGKAVPLSRSTASRPSLKETIAAQKRAKMAGKDLPDRPGSAQASFSPIKPHIPSASARSGTAMSTASRTTSIATTSTTHTGSLSSAPVRPMKPRRPDLPRPATADPYASRRAQKTETPSMSPNASPARSRPKTPAPAASNVKSRITAKKADSPAMSPVKGRGKKLDAIIASSSDDHPLSHLRSPTKAAEDFTMVMPSMNALKEHIISPNEDTTFEKTITSLETSMLADPFSMKPTEDIPNPMSPTANLGATGYMPLSRQEDTPNPTSPRVNLGVNGYTSSIRENGQKRSMSPRIPYGRKENMATSRIQDLAPRSPGPLKVYEDPVPVIKDQMTSRPATKVTALEELPVNEPTNSHFTGPVSPNHVFADVTYHQNRKGVEVADSRKWNPELNYQPNMARKMLDSGIVRMRAGTMDGHGFRKLQGMLWTKNDIWDDHTAFDETLMALLEYMESPDGSEPRKISKAVLDLKTQVLVTIRMMLSHYREFFSTFYPLALSTMLSTRKHYGSNSHIVSMLEETAEDIVDNCDPRLCIDAVLDLLETEKIDEKGNRTRIMGLYMLAGLLRTNTLRKENIDNLSALEMNRLWKLSLEGLGDTDSDIRRAAIEYTLGLHDVIQPKNRFWEMVASAREDHRNLITYYLAKRERS